MGNVSVIYVLEASKPGEVVEYFRKRFEDKAQAVRARLQSMDRETRATATQKDRAAARLELYIYETELDVLSKLRIDPPSPATEIAKLPKLRAALKAAKET